MNKSDTHAFVNQLLIYTLVMICFSGSIGLGTVWMRQQMAQTAASIKQLETRAADVERHSEELNRDIGVEQSIENLKRRNGEWRLGLMQPAESQIQRVGLPSPEQQLVARRNSDLFSKDTARTSVHFSTTVAQK